MVSFQAADNTIPMPVQSCMYYSGMGVACPLKLSVARCIQKSGVSNHWTGILDWNGGIENGME